MLMDQSLKKFEVTFVESAHSNACSWRQLTVFCTETIYHAQRD